MRRRKLPARTLMLTVALVAVAAAACGSSSKTAASSSSSSSPSTTTSSGTATTSRPSSYRGSSGGNFCDLVRQDKAAFNADAAIATMTPTDLKSLFVKLVPALRQMQSVAPSAIKADLATFVPYFGQINSALAAAGYKFENVNLTTFEALTTPQVKAASSDIARYVTQVCHVGTPTATT